MKSRKLVIAVGATLVMSAQFAAAQSGPVAKPYTIPDKSEMPDRDGPRALPLADGVTLTPFFNLSFGRDDNLLSQNTNKKASDFQIYNPGLRLEAKGASSQFGLGYALKAGKYSSSSADDYTDYKLDGSGEFVMSSSLGLKLTAHYTRGHDPRGTTDRGIGGTPDEFRSNGASALFAYGANDAKGRIEVDASTVDKRYLNNRSTTLGSDRNTDSFGGRFFFKVAPKTSLLIEAKQDKIDYKLSSSLQDSKETRYLVGVTWDATAATSGTIKVGQIKKDFNVASRKDFSGTGWDANMSWKPVSYSKFDFFTSKSFAESTGLGDFMLSKRYGSSWTHGWNSRLNSTVSISRNDDSYSGATRSDKTDTLGLKLNYQLMRWLSIGGEYNTTNRDSSAAGSNFKKNMYMITLGATL